MLSCWRSSLCLRFSVQLARHTLPFSSTRIELRKLILSRCTDDACKQLCNWLLRCHTIRYSISTSKWLATNDDDVETVKYIAVQSSKCDADWVIYCTLPGNRSQKCKVKNSTWIYSVVRPRVTCFDVTTILNELSLVYCWSFYKMGNLLSCIAPMMASCSLGLGITDGPDAWMRKWGVRSTQM